METRKDIHPLFDKIVQREAKEFFLKQHAKVIWLTGLSGSGKSTIAIELEKEFLKKGYLTQVLDGDNIRTGINADLKFSNQDRKENIRRISEISRLFINCGIITINCFISPSNAMRELSKRIIGKNDYIEVYINAPFAICEKRDVKGLYKKAREKRINHFTGISSDFEPPKNPNIEIKTDKSSVKESVNKLFEYVLPIIELKD